MLSHQCQSCYREWFSWWWIFTGMLSSDQMVALDKIRFTVPLVVTLCGAVKIKRPIDIMCLPPKESTVPWKNHDKTVPQAKGPNRAAFTALIPLIAKELINASSTHLSIFCHCLSCTQGHRGWCQSQLICSEDRVRHGHVLSLINTSFNPYLSIPKKTTKMSYSHSSSIFIIRDDRNSRFIGGKSTLTAL